MIKIMTSVRPKVMVRAFLNIIAWYNKNEWEIASNIPPSFPYVKSVEITKK